MANGINKHYYYIPTSSLFFRPVKEILHQISSLDKNASFLITSIGLTDNEKSFFINEYSCEILEMPEVLKSKINFQGSWPKEIIFKYFLAFYLPESIERVICLGADMVIQKDISGLFDIDMQDSPLAACVEDSGNYTDRFSLFNQLPEDRVYVNAELLVINLTYFRTHYSENQLLSAFFKIEKDCIYYEQDFLNYYFYGKIKILRSPLNFQVMEHLGNSEFKRFFNYSYVIHFSTSPKPWQKKSTYRMTRLYYPFASDKEFQKDLKILMLKEIIIAPFRLLKSTLGRIKCHIKSFFVHSF